MVPWAKGFKAFAAPTLLSPSGSDARNRVSQLGLARRAQVILRPTLPSVLGLQTCAIAARQGHRVEGWYSSGQGGIASATAALVMIARISGCRIQFPQVLPDDDCSSAAERVAKLCEAGVPCVYRDQSARRYVAARRSTEISTRRRLFLVSGESLTDAKRAVPEQGRRRSLRPLWRQANWFSSDIETGR